METNETTPPPPQREDQKATQPLRWITEEQLALWEPYLLRPGSATR